MGYLFLVLGILLGVSAQLCVKMSKGFKVMIPTFFSFLLFISCFYFISLATNYLEVGVVFAIWAGITIVCTTLLGIILFGESNNKRKTFSILCIIVGVVLLKLV